MIRQGLRGLSVLLSASILFSTATFGLSAYALNNSEVANALTEPSEEDFAPPDTNPTFQARIAIIDGTRDTGSEASDEDVTLTAGDGAVSDTSASGIQIATEKVGYSGIYVSGADSHFTLGGSGANFTYHGISFDSAILLGNSAASDLTYENELDYGAGFANSGGTSTILNSYIYTEGSGRPAVYVNNGGTLIVKDSYFETAGGTETQRPTYMLINGTTRAALDTGGTAYYYNSTVVADAWGALSTDVGGDYDTYLYAYNTDAQSTNGGYGAYADSKCWVYFYGGRLTSGEYGAILANSGELYTDTTDAVTNAVKANMDADDYVAANEGTSIIGGRNAIMVHTVSPFNGGDDSAALTDTATLDMKDGVLSTVTDLTSAADYANDGRVGASSVYIAHHYGTDVLFRSGNAIVNLDNVTMESSGGVLFQSVPDYDVMGAVYVQDGHEALGIHISLKDMKLTGDILHEDYQRTMTLDLENTSITGQVVSGTMEAWNELWSDETDEIQADLIQDEAYETVWGVDMTMDANSAWTVTETSSLASLTVAEGAAIEAPEGKTITIYTGCDMDNDDAFYSYLTGTETAALVAGQTYTGVVLLIADSGAGSGGEMPPAINMPTLEEIASQAAIYVDGANVSTENDNGSSIFGGSLRVANGGSISGDVISGVEIIGADYSAATEDKSADNGIIIDKDSSADTVTVGGDTGFYQIDTDGDGTADHSFNSSIILTNEAVVDDSIEADDGTNIILGVGNLLLDNVYLKTSGLRAPVLYAMDGESSLVVKDSWLQCDGGDNFHPIFTMMTSSARATLLCGGESWFYNTDIIDRSWGGLSQESGTIVHTYAVNSYLETYEGGYGAYVLDKDFMSFYGTEMQSNNFGLFLCGSAETTVGTIADALADETVAANMTVNQVTIDPSDYEVDGGKSIIGGTVNAIMVHTNGAVDTSAIATVNAHDSIITTDPQNGLAIVGKTGQTLGDLDIDWRWTDSDGTSDYNNGQSWFMMKDMWGADVLIRSMNTNMTFDNCDMYSGTGVLLQSVISFDPMGGTAMFRESGGEEKSGIFATFKNNDYVGDVLHQDYHRQMTVTLENATLTGEIESYTMAAWNNLWSEEHMAAMLNEAGLSAQKLTKARVAKIQDTLIYDESYDGDTVKTGVNLSVDADSVWTVTKTSSLGSLTVAKGGSVAAPDGYSLSFYVNCDTSSDLLFYDYAGATKLASLEPGVTYQDVVVVVQPASGTGATDIIVVQPEGNLPQTGTQAVSLGVVLLVVLGSAALSAAVICRKYRMHSF